MVHPKAKGMPTVIAVQHLDDTKIEEQPKIIRASIRLGFLLRQLAQDKAKRTIYLEGSPVSIHGLEKESMLWRAMDPFCKVLHFAKEMGWKIVPLDSPETDHNVTMME